MIATTSNVHELLDWMSAAERDGITRFELWMKPRSAEQRRLVAFEVGVDLWNAADETFTLVQRDRRVEQGFVTYAVCGFRDDEPAAVARAFVSPASSAMAFPVHDAELASPHVAAAAIAPVLQPILATVQSTFELLQRENEHQRKANEVHVRSASGHFDALARGYERTFTELQRRLDGALLESQELRAKLAAFDDERAKWTEAVQDLMTKYEELAKTKMDDGVKAQRQMARERIGVDALTFGVPLLASLVTKTPMIGGAGGEVMKRFFSSLSPEQLQALMTILSPAQQAVIGLAFRQQTDDAPAAPSGPEAVAEHGATNGTPATTAAEGTPSKESTAPPASTSTRGEAPSPPPAGS